ncbi:adenylate/guanylate cyclase domain-containing protein [Actinotalea sp. M2MS4P-6]|uniref:adenylate/guanylate cyclase domain-containing protein n=1 Tax=Actinotalea sp. M2MS4P-6 TaxID=2983762 RepID=UPI0021E39A18|nr:adenylate/guanylate cyclase domain-containing protein [Actinotalea sp. M2MS4P-6]MCV2396333.1 adenylate/guanylate cyclase domain-containing protein [Actinotalea sp. M2MS4P-6]
MTEQPRRRPWWRRPRRLSRQLAAALVVTALLAVVTFGVLNFVAARNLLVGGTEAQLAAVGATRADTIEAGAQRLIAEVSTASTDPAIATGLKDVTAAFAELEDRELTPEQLAELESWYADRVVGPANDAGLGPYDVATMLPSTTAGRWVQYQYTMRPAGAEPPVDAGDGTTYSAVSASLSAPLQGMSDGLGGGDVLLVDATGTIVFSLDKGNDLGTSLVTGPYAGSELARVVTERLPLARLGTTLLTDFTIYATGRVALFAVTAVRSGNEVVGALAVQVPVSAINALTSADGSWDAIGLADGDAYLVSANLTLQSEPRAWLEDPQGYLERLRSGTEEEQAEADLIEVFGSPVGIQVVDTAPVRAALDGAAFRGATRSDLGDQTFAAAESFNPGGRQWVVVTEVPRSSSLAPLTEYVLRILLVLAIVLPVVAGLGLWLSRLLTRPIPPTVDAAAAIVDGERHPEVDTARRDEFGDLGRRLTAMAEALAAHEAQLAEEYERTRRLLLAVLPPQLVDADGKVVGTGEAADLATVVAVTIAAADAEHDLDQLGEALGRSAELAERVAEEAGLQRVRVAADRYLFIGGLGADDDGADVGLRFAREFQARLAADPDLSLDVHLGLSTGAVGTGVLETGTLTFGAWGEPVRRALALAALARVDSVLVDGTTFESCSAVDLGPAHEVLDLDGRPLDLYTFDGTPDVSART